MKPARRRGSLLGKILRANVLVAGVSVISLTALLLFGFRTEYERQQTVRAQMLAQFVARQSEVPALIGDRGSIEKIALNALGGEDVVVVHIEYRGQKQEVVATRPVTRDAGANPVSISGKAWIEAVEEIRPIQSGMLDWDETSSGRPESLGRVTLRISLRKEQALFLHTVERSLAVMGGLLLLIVALQFSQMQNLLRPLGSLVAFAKRVDTGDLLERSGVDQADEIAGMAVAFNQMLDRLGQTTVSRDYVDNIIRSMAECLIVVGGHGRIRMVNDATLALLGYTEGDLVGQHVSMIDVRDSSAPMEVISGTERVWRTRDGRSIAVLFSSAALLPGRSSAAERNEEAFVWLAQDISERKRIQQELIAARDKAEEAVRLKGEFLANMSHEIRTPMNIIIGMTQLTLSSELDTRQRRHLSMVDSAAAALLTLINDILDFSKIEANKLDLSAVEFNLSECLHERIAGLSIGAREKGLDLKVEIDRDVPRTVIADPVRLGQIVLNLVGNAIKFSSEGAIGVRISLEGQSTAAGAHLRFTVTDGGIGIPADKLAAIFDPFRQADGSTTRRYGGTGLGLSISRRLVEMMDGQIRVESEMGKGSTFTFTIRVGLPQGSSEPGVSRGMIIMLGAERGACISEMLARSCIEADSIDNPIAALEIIKWAGKLGRPFTFVLIKAGEDHERFVDAMKSHPDLTNLPVLPIDWPIAQSALLDLVSVVENSTNPHLCGVCD